MKKKRPCLYLALMLALAPLTPAGASGADKPKLKSQIATPQASSNASQAASAQGADAPRLRDGLALPAPPAAPGPPPSPAMTTAAPLKLRAPQDNGAECRQACAAQRYRCMAGEPGTCDSTWSTCVINCNLPGARETPFG